MNIKSEGKEKVGGDTFFDIHMHAFNLSHPDFRAFINRFKGKIVMMQIAMAVVGILSAIEALLKMMKIPLVRRMVYAMLRKIMNLLAIMDRDIGSFFLTTENCVREAENPLLRGAELYIGNHKYKRMVLTPLMMDFGFKAVQNVDIDSNLIKVQGEKGQPVPETVTSIAVTKAEKAPIHYWKMTGKPIVGQVTDLLTGIRNYKYHEPKAQLAKKYEALTPDTDRILEIYPFLGMNTSNYDFDRVDTMLKKYFGNYKQNREELRMKMGEFKGNIKNEKEDYNNYFCGIKVYPPLGFDPWPDVKGERDADKKKQKQLERDKVEHLYAFCVKNHIPITSHASEGGFVTLSKSDVKKYTSIKKWAAVLAEYPELKLNMAHFPMKEKLWFIIPDPRHPRLKAMIDLMTNKKYPNVYSDFSNRAVKDKYYKKLRKVLDSQPRSKKEKLEQRILFGSDFTVNLMGIESYNKYLDLFSRTSHLTDEEKHQFCSENPDRFLFG